MLVNGGWSQWHDWGHCSAECGDGNQKRIRVCDNPIPEYGGTDCTENGSKSSESKNCVGNKCPGNTNHLKLLIYFKKERKKKKKKKKKLQFFILS